MGLNGFFTVARGVSCALFAVYFGFIATMLLALASHVLAYFMIRVLVIEKVIWALRYIAKQISSRQKPGRELILKTTKR